jgi:hypothetical protein
VPGSLPNGSYHFAVTGADIADVEMPADFREEALGENVGSYTWRLSGGKWHAEQAADPQPVLSVIDGTYVVESNVVTFYFPSGMTFKIEEMLSYGLPPAPVERFRWTRMADGAIRLTPLDDTDALAAAVMASHPWLVSASV